MSTIGLASPDSCRSAMDHNFTKGNHVLEPKEISQKQPFKLTIHATQFRFLVGVYLFGPYLLDTCIVHHFFFWLCSIVSVCEGVHACDSATCFRLSKSLPDIWARMCTRLVRKAIWKLSAGNWERAGIAISFHGANIALDYQFVIVLLLGSTGSCLFKQIHTSTKWRSPPLQGGRVCKSLAALACLQRWKWLKELIGFQITLLIFGVASRRLIVTSG